MNGFNNNGNWNGNWNGNNNGNGYYTNPNIPAGQNVNVQGAYGRAVPTQTGNPYGGVAPQNVYPVNNQQRMGTPYMGQPVQQPMNFNADTVIAELNNAVTSVYNGTITDVYHVRDTVNRMVQEGKIRKIGGGQNRVAIELVPDDSRYKQMLGMNGPMLLMVPIKIPEGIKDNLRASEGYRRVHQMGLQQSQAAMTVLNSYLPSVLIQGTYILAQRRVTRIEDSNGVKNLMASGKYQNNQLALACRDYLIDNPNIYQQYVQLISSFDQFFVMADLDAEFSPWNYGFDYINGQEKLVIIDYGYLKWKTHPNICPVCKKELHYCIPKEQFLEDPRNKGLKLAVGQFGQYSCKNPQCKHSANGKLAPYMERDIDVFIRYGE